MEIEQGFLTDIAEHPDDDAPRLIYADWLEECAERQDDSDPRYARGQFIRAQINAARAETEVQRVAADQRACTLLAKYQHEWQQPFYDMGASQSFSLAGFLTR